MCGHDFDNVHALEEHMVGGAHHVPLEDRHIALKTLESYSSATPSNFSCRLCRQEAPYEQLIRRQHLVDELPDVRLYLLNHAVKKSSSPEDDSPRKPPQSRLHRKHLLA